MKSIHSQTAFLPLLFLTNIAWGCFAVTAHATDPVHEWSKRFGETGEDAAFSVATDGAGNVVITGLFQTGFSFGGRFHGAKGTFDVFLAKFDPNGTYIWSRTFGNIPSGGLNGITNARAVAVDGSGGIAMAGYFEGTMSFGGAPLTAVGSGLFVAKYDASGVHVWSRALGPYGPEDSFGLAEDGSGNTIITAAFGGSMNFGGDPLTSVGGSDIVIAKYDANGAHLWSRRLGSSGNDYGIDVAVDGAGNFVVTGLFSGAVNFGGTTLTSVGATDVFLARYDADGVHQWSRRMGGTNYDDVAGVAVNVAGDVAIHGELFTSANYGGQTLTSVGSTDVYVAKYDTGGLHVWSQRFGGVDTDRARAIAMDGLGDVAISGNFSGTADFGGEPIAGGVIDIYLARYDAAGVHKWSRAFGHPATIDEGYGIATDALGDVFLTGAFTQTIDFGGGVLTTEGWDDIFLVKFSEESPVPVLFTRFTATPRGAAVEIAWDVSSDEVLGEVALYRREGAAAEPILVATGSALAGHSYVDAAVEAGRTYHYELVVRTAGGDVFRSVEATATVPALTSTLEQNQPNPFNPSTTVTYTLSERAFTSIGIYDATGALVARLDEGEHERGTHRVEWNGRDSAGQPVASGVYVYRLEGVVGVDARKMLLLK
jgi:FlgD Ig-like domain